jgi:hypothetical protein
LPESSLKFQERIVYIGLTLGALNFLLFLLGHAGLLSTPYMVAAVFLTIVAIAFIFRDIKLSSVTTYLSSLTLIEKLTLLFILVFILLLLPLALTPPSVRDELILHLELPRLYLLAGAIVKLPFLDASSSPANIDILYLLPMALGSDIAPRLMHMAFGLLTGLVVYGYLMPRAGRAYALLGLLFFISTPLVFNLSRMAYVDLGLTFFTTLSLVCALEWDGGLSNVNPNGRSVRWLVYSGVFMGLALGCKYNVLIGLLLVTLLVLWLALKAGAGQMKAIKAAFIFLFVVLIVFSPWMIRNYIWIGSPLYPIYQVVSSSISSGDGIYVGGTLTPLEVRHHLYGEGVLDIIIIPLRIFIEGVDNSIKGFDGVLNPFFIFFIIMAFLRGRQRDVKIFITFSVLFIYMALFTSEMVTRYVLPAFVPFVILMVYGVRNIINVAQGDSRLRGLSAKAFVAVGALMLIALFVFNTSYALKLERRYSPLSYVFGSEEREDYLKRVVPEYEVIEYANKNIPSDALVQFMFSGNRGYYWEREYLPGNIYGSDLIRGVRGSDSAEELRERFTSSGITHIFLQARLFERFAADNFNAKELGLLGDFFNKHAVPLFASNNFILYEVR